MDAQSTSVRQAVVWRARRYFRAPVGQLYDGLHKTGFDFVSRRG